MWKQPKALTIRLTKYPTRRMCLSLDDRERTNEVPLQGGRGRWQMGVDQCSCCNSVIGKILNSGRRVRSQERTCRILFLFPFFLSFFVCLDVCLAVHCRCRGYYCTLSHPDTHHTRQDSPWTEDRPFAVSYTWQHTTRNRHARHRRDSNPSSPASERPQSHVLDRAANGTGSWLICDAEMAHTGFFSCQLSFHKCSSFTVTVSPQHMLQTKMV
jgi:hypothetical protein